MSDSPINEDIYDVFIPSFDQLESEEESIDILERVQDFLGNNSPLKGLFNGKGHSYEPRPQQLAMAEKFVDCLKAGKHLTVEAPTGVGKSFAYLVPAILHAVQSNKPVVISTHTIALQEQLIHKDIPALQALMDINFRAELAKGRENYLCLHRLGNCIVSGDEYLPGLVEENEFERISSWSERTQDGTKSDLGFTPNATIWSSVCSEVGVCPMERKKSPDCFFAKARKALFQADIIVANHALLCTDLAMRMESNNQSSILPDYGALIIDEAHTFEQVASIHLGLRISSFSLVLQLNKLKHSRSGKGLVSKVSDNELHQAVTNAHSSTSIFFKQFQEWLDAYSESTVGYYTPGHIPNNLFRPLSELIKRLKIVTTENDYDLHEDLKRELDVIRERIQQIRNGMDEILQMTRDKHVYWFERFGRDRQHVAMQAVPVEIRHVLKEVLFGQNFPVLMTSATIAINKEVDYFLHRLGCFESETLILDSPYNYKKQVELYIPHKDAPIPDPRSEELPDAIIPYIEALILKTNGKAFVLFTSYTFMQLIGDLMSDFFLRTGIDLFIQGRGLQRTEMLHKFKENTDSVLFGTDSFWMGVDVPGEALSHVIIPKLPFSVPSHPLTKAIHENLRDQGKNPFIHHTLPEAVLKFRQGFGRLIRSKNDTGVVTILDRRIVHTGYGKTFLNSLPECNKKTFILPEDI
ncbi:MAG: DEAD/DEAH box helicase family protein [Lentisphaeria bacterium]|nr:DEAD/DEAH box helicase family protein [Lentisphaeria bacterium]